MGNPQSKQDEKVVTQNADKQTIPEQIIQNQSISKQSVRKNKKHRDDKVLDTQNAHEQPIPKQIIQKQSIPMQSASKRTKHRNMQNSNSRRSCDEIEPQDRNVRDDEPITKHHTISSETSDQEDIEISLHFARNYLTPTDISQEWPCTVLLKAPETNETKRSGVDIICVIDVSGSMNGDKIELVQKTLEFMITQMASDDRVSIVSFNNFSEKLLPLTVMNDSGKIKAQEAIERLYTSGGTNIISGLDYGINIAVNRNIENNSTAIILLSDGCDRCRETALERTNACIENYNSSNVSYTIHSFGYGSDHDAKVLSAIAEAKNGGFYYVEKFESIASAFANCLGELLSTIASEIQINLQTLPAPIEYLLTKVYSSNGDIQFSMPNVMAGDSKEAVFILEFPPSQFDIGEGIDIIPIRATVKYTLIKTGLRKTENRELVIRLRPDFEEVKFDESVLNNFYRVKTAEILKEAGIIADKGKLDKARKLVLNQANELKNCICNSTELVKMLEKDLKKASKRFENYSEYERGGRADINSMAMNHRSKRGENNVIYQNCAQKKMQVKSKNFFSS
ncbi:hypothetical protein SteCoe_16209 [Stentor coeruleus]|uniref:VWFA domain-containing protein n=1 Tax=Stentor coeruleus TaxID=5963 RepID=A0A1R2C225_9CILI|nr:hypothetical protein SteCoe_16209 [Stentor coeruleus]